METNDDTLVLHNIPSHSAFSYECNCPDHCADKRLIYAVPICTKPDRFCTYRHYVAPKAK